MDIVKRFERIVHIFFLLQSKAVVKNEEIQERFQIGRRTVYRDLKVLERAGVPIVSESGEGFSIMEGYRMQPSKFTHEEVFSLVIAEKIMQTHETEFVKKNFETALIKVKSSFLVHQKNHVLNLEDKLHFTERFTGAEFLPDLMDVLLAGILKKQIVNIAYLKSSEMDVIGRSIEAVGLFHENNAWYVLAYCHLRGNYRNFRLDRIKKIALSDDPFTRKHLSVNQIQQIESQSNVTKIVISVEKQYAHFLFWERQSYGFTSQEIQGEEIIMYFDCQQHPISFVRWFMRFIDVAKLIKPLQLQDELKTIMLAGLKKLDVLSDHAPD
jgi:predicted DNA-binding transcriptional regulator YafY